MGDMSTKKRRTREELADLLDGIADDFWEGPHVQADILREAAASLREELGGEVESRPLSQL